MLASVLENGGWGRSHGHVGVTTWKNGGAAAAGGLEEDRAPEPQDQPPKPALSCVPRYLAVRTGFLAVREQAGQSAGPTLGRNSREKGAAVMRSVLLLANSLSSRSG